MTLKALIPVRKGSQRVLDKNIRPFCDSSLLEIKIEQLKRIKTIDEIVVNSDCEKMLKIASSLGVETVLRDPYYATSSVPMNEVWENMAQCIDCEDVLYTNVTNPLINDDTYEKIIKKWKTEIKQKHEHDSITTTHEVREYLWNQENKPVNYNPSSHPRSQDLPLYYGLNFAISIIPRKLMIERKSIIGERFFPFTIDKIQAIDIDDNDDFLLASNIYNERFKNKQST